MSRPSNPEGRRMRLRRQQLIERSEVRIERRARRSYVRPYVEHDLFGRTEYELPVEASGG